MIRSADCRSVGSNAEASGGISALNLENGLRCILATEQDIIERILAEVAIYLFNLLQCIDSIVPSVFPHAEFRNQHPAHRCAHSSLAVIREASLDHIRNTFLQFLDKVVTGIRRRHSLHLRNLVLCIDIRNRECIERNVSVETCQDIPVESSDNLDFSKQCRLLFFFDRRSFDSRDN